MIKQHVLLPLATGLEEADARMTALVTNEEIQRIVGLVPESWLVEGASAGEAARRGAAYVGYLQRRRETSQLFVEEAIRARAL